MHEDTIPVRPDERFDEVRLAEYLRGRLPGTDQPLAVRQFGGGAANLTYLLDYGGQEYTLRRPPLGPVAATAHDMGREYRVLSVLHQAFPYAPQAYLYCDDLEVIGAPFFVMERKRGVVVHSRMPVVFQTFPDAPQQMCQALVDGLVDFHAVDYHALGLADLGKPQGFITRQITGWHRRWNAAKLHDLPEMDMVHTWLLENEPPNQGNTLVHNDYKLNNVMLDPDDPGRLVAVFDWDMCTLGDPLSDLGALLTYWAEPNDPPFMQAIAGTFMPVGDARFWTREQIVSRYVEQSGRDVTDIRFYHLLGIFRVAVIIAQIYIRYHRGQTQDERFAGFWGMVEGLTQYAARMLSM